MDDFYVELADAIQIEPEKCNGGTTISEETIDSLGLISLITLLDEHYGVVLDRDKIMSFSNVGDLVAFAKETSAN